MEIIPGAQRSTAAGDVNKDNVDDIFISIPRVEHTTETNPVLQLFLGSPTGLILNQIYYTTQEYVGRSVARAGDINGDGYPDVIAGGIDFDVPAENVGRIVAFLGGESGIASQPDFMIPSSTIPQGLGRLLSYVGDVNGDGFDDILTAGNYQLFAFYGSANGPKLVPDWSSPDTVLTELIEFAGDINHDGFNDFFSTPAAPTADDSITVIYVGSPNGPVRSNILVPGRVRSAGDINNDGYIDIFRINNNRGLDLFMGELNGFKPTTWSKNELYRFRDFRYGTAAGDINGDGYGDVMVHTDTNPLTDYSRIDIYLGNAFGLEDEPIYKVPGISENNGDFTASIYPIGPAGDVNGDGADDMIASTTRNQLDINIILYGIKSTPGTNPPVVDCPSDTIVCMNNSGLYSIDTLKASSDQGLKQINFFISGNTVRQGSGTDASGEFNVGTSHIIWQAEDLNGNISSCTTKVVILENKLKFRIPTAYAVNKEQSKPNTIYLGYKNNSLRLTAYVMDGVGPFKYLWSTGDTTRFLRVKHDVPGTYKYHVTVRDSSGCMQSDSVDIYVVDNSCPNLLKEIVEMYFPQYLTNPFVQYIIASTTQYHVCNQGKAQCVYQSKLDAHIAHGASLGSCVVPGISNQGTEHPKDMIASNELSVKAFPNPSDGAFSIMVSGTNGYPYSVQILNSLGTPVFRKQNIREQRVEVGSTLANGVYYVEVLSNKQRKIIKLIKIK